MKSLTRFVLFLVVYPFSLFGQNEIKGEVIVYNDGTRVNFQVVSAPANFSFDDEKKYSWFRSEYGIQETKGGAGGDFLHGELQVFDGKGSLRKTEQYSFGLQSGKFKNWNEDGKIVEKGTFNDGRLEYHWKREPIKEIIETYGEFPFEPGSSRKWYDEYGKIKLERVCPTSEEKAIMVDASIPALFVTTDTKYYPNGSVNYVITTSGGDDFKFSKEMYYYSDGKKQYQGEFNKYGCPVGTSYWYDFQGRVTSSETFRFEINRHQDGTIASYGSYVRSGDSWLRHGRWQYWEKEFYTIDNTMDNLSDLLDLSEEKMFDYGVEKPR